MARTLTVRNELSRNLPYLHLNNCRVSRVGLSYKCGVCSYLGHLPLNKSLGTPRFPFSRCTRRLRLCLRGRCCVRARKSPRIVSEGFSLAGW